MGVRRGGSRRAVPASGLWGGRIWDEQFGGFSRTYRVLRFDFRGYGRSSCPEPGRPYSHVDDVAAVMDAASVERAALVGCSMGGSTALDFALTYPSRVSALVLASSGMNAFDDRLTPEEEAELELLDAPVAVALETGDIQRAERARLRIWAPLGTEDEAGRRISEIAFDNIHEMTMDETGRRDISPPAIERLEQIEAPTLVLPADNDALVFRRLSASWPSASPMLGSSRSPRRTMSSTCDNRPSSTASFSGSSARSSETPGYFRASSFSCCAAAMILSARCDGTSS